MACSNVSARYQRVSDLLTGITLRFRLEASGYKKLLSSATALLLQYIAYAPKGAAACREGIGCEVWSHVLFILRSPIQGDCLVAHMKV